MHLSSLLFLFVNLSYSISEKADILDYTRILESFHERFYMKCLNLINSEEALFKNGNDLLRIIKLLSSKDILSYVVSVNRMDTTNKCDTNRPMNVMFSSDRDVQMYLRNIPQVKHYFVNKSFLHYEYCTLHTMYIFDNHKFLHQTCLLLVFEARIQSLPDAYFFPCLT